MQGTVKSYNGAKGFGFINTTQVEGDIFFGRSDLPEDSREVQGKFMTGRQVVFQLEQTPEGKHKASSVQLGYVRSSEGKHSDSM